AGRGTALTARDPGLGGDHDTVARDALDCLADDALGTVNRGGVEEIDPEIQRLADQGDGFCFALAGPEAEPAEAAAAEPGNADPEPGAAERDVFHPIEPPFARVAFGSKEREIGTDWATSRKRSGGTKHDHQVHDGVCRPRRSPRLRPGHHPGQRAALLER